MLPLHPEHKISFLLGDGVNRPTIYPKSQFCTKPYKSPIRGIFRGIFDGFFRFFCSFRTFLRNAEKENCKFGTEKCDSVLEVFLKVCRFSYVKKSVYFVLGLFSFILFFVTQGKKEGFCHQPYSESESVGKCIPLAHAIHFIHGFFVFFKRFLLLVRQ